MPGSGEGKDQKSGTDQEADEIISNRNQIEWPKLICYLRWTSRIHGYGLNEPWNHVWR